jgi:hypothetical protein
LLLSEVSASRAPTSHSRLPPFADNDLDHPIETTCPSLHGNAQTHTTLQRKPFRPD